LRIVTGNGRLVRPDGDMLLVPGAPDRVAARIAGFLKQTARDRLAASSDHYANALGRSYTRLTLRDTRSRWGSCTADGGLMYSWRLIMAPPEVLNYVAAHEVAHLAEMNHSDAFWQVVTRLYGDYRAPRRWLREKGGDLHRYRFGA
jgi:predicted metal-dependent hydrolase